MFRRGKWGSLLHDLGTKLKNTSFSSLLSSANVTCSSVSDTLAKGMYVTGGWIKIRGTGSMLHMWTLRKQDLCFGLALGHHVSGSCTSVQETKAKLA